VKKVARDVLDSLEKTDPLLDLAMQLEEAALADDYFVERKLYPNVDFYTGVIYKALGFPTPMFTVLFAIGRLPGWIAQWREMIADPTTKIGRPAAGLHRARTAAPARLGGVVRTAGRAPGALDRFAAMTTLRTRTALTAALLTLTTAACGGGDEPSPAPGAASAAPSASASATPGPLTTPEASSAASEINLTPADLPGYTATPPDETTSTATEAAEDSLGTCVGASTAEPVADFASDDYAKGTDLPALNVSSNVNFVADPGQVTKDIAAFSAPKAEGCVATFFKDVISSSGDGLEFDEPKVTRLTPSAPGTDGAFGFRVETAAQAEGQTIPFTLDLLAFGKARTSVGLIVFGVGTSVPEAERDALFAKLVERGSANAL
jgi:hypothetical protein